MRSVVTALSQVPKHLKIAVSQAEISKIWQLRDTQYSKYYPTVSDAKSDVYDDNACVLYSKNKTGKVVSTGRMVFDGSNGIPSDDVIKAEVDKLRKKGLVIAEPSKFAITKEARGILPTYLLTYYKMAIKLGIDSLVFIIRDKNVRLYKKIIDATVLVADVGYSYGTRYKFSFLECKIKRHNKPYLFTWLGEKSA